MEVDMRKEAQTRLAQKYPGILPVLRASCGDHFGRREWKRVRSIQERALTANDLDLPVYHRTDCRWDNQKAEDGYVVREIETTSHSVAVVHQDGYVEHLEDFEYRMRYDEGAEPDDLLDEGDEAEPPWTPLRSLIPRTDQVAYLVIVSRTERQWIEGMYFDDHLVPTGKTWPEEIIYDTEVLLP